MFLAPIVKDLTIIAESLTTHTLDLLAGDQHDGNDCNLHKSRDYFVMFVSVCEINQLSGMNKFTNWLCGKLLYFIGSFY